MSYKRYLKKIENKGADFSDIRIMESESERISVENGNVNLAQKDIKLQYGVRVFYDGAWGFSYGNKLNKINSSLDRALKLAKLNSEKTKKKFKLQKFPSKTDDIKQKGKSFTDTSIEERINELLEYDKLLKKKVIVNRELTNVFSKRKQKYFNSFGADISEEREYFNFYFKAVGKKKDKMRQIFKKKGMCATYNDFEKIDFKKLINEKLKRLKDLFKAKKAPAGNYPLVIDDVLSHVFFHEAIGHACEADAILENSSVLKGRIGDKIGPDFLTLADDATIKNEHGSYAYDEEGVKAQETIMIKNGVLTNYLHSLETASRLKMKPTGNCRAQNANSFPYPRMSNTVLYAGDYKREELFKGIKKGIYAKGSSGGIVEPTNGNFLFNTREAYLIEDGKITKPLMDVSFGGNILQTLQHIKKIGKDSNIMYGGWMCGKKSQTVPVGGKSPHVMISQAMVGGQNA